MKYNIVTSKTSTPLLKKMHVIVKQKQNTEYSHQLMHQVILLNAVKEMVI
jgi:hypothetical protein